MIVLFIDKVVIDDEVIIIRIISKVICIVLILVI